MVLNAIGVLLAIATAGVFILGMFSMTRGGAHDRQHSGGLMLARVEMQALALALLALATYLFKL
jgi:hypothetical protein